MNTASTIEGQTPAIAWAVRDTGVRNEQGGYTIRPAWIGNASGPRVFREPFKGIEPHMIARVVATIMNEQFGTTTRFRAMPFTENEATMHPIDTITAPITGTEALRRMEGKEDKP